MTELYHIGTPRHSGRYPWGSGSNPNQRNKSFLDYVDDLHKKGMSEKDIAEGVGMSTTQLRAKKAIAKDEQRKESYAQALRLKDKGMSNVAIGKQMGINESSVRAILDPAARARQDILVTTSNMLKANVDKKGLLDIGEGVENYVGVSKDKLRTAVSMLEEQGYTVHRIKVPQLGTTNETTVKVLAPPGTTFGDVIKNKDKIGYISDHTDDGGRSYLGLKPPQNLNSDRVKIRYADEGGSDMDGVIQLRRNVDDVSLGNSKYAQVRIAVDGSHYLKGMAMYSDDMPDGVDVIFNTNKNSTGNKLDAMKKLKADDKGNIDKDNPFGAVIKPGGQRGVLNIVNEEGDWGKWSRSLSSQMLSKQSPTLAKTQLDLKLKTKQEEYDDIISLTNPSVKKKLLESFADDLDSSAVHLKAAALPRQATHAILPINSLKDGEIYAPNYRNGEKVVLVRYPHGGIFEIPELTVNNRNPEAISILSNKEGRARDAVGINSKVASRLSGADFDGDTVLVIPNNSGSVKTDAPLIGLKDFDPQTRYPGYPGMTPMSPRTKQLKMGDVSNLITDMTVMGAHKSEIARAVRHSMVVIDAEKHNLNWKQSQLDNGIGELKKKYQGSSRSGASTIISRSSSEQRVLERKPRSASKGGHIDSTTGKKVFEDTGASYVNKDGKTVIRTTKSNKMTEVGDAHKLSSGTPMEVVYAEHANKLKALANTARKEMVSTTSIPYSPSAKAAYQNEVASLNAKLNVALKNKPLERQAQLLANATVSAKRKAYPNMEQAELKKIKGQALAEARTRTGAKKLAIVFTQDEWNAVQAGAISSHMLNSMLANADLDQVKKLANPRDKPVMSSARIARAKSMLTAGFTQAEIADALGVPTTTLNDSLN